MQDFPVTGASLTDLPDIHQDHQPFRLTLRCFIKELIRQRFPYEDERPDRLGPLSVFVRLLQDVDFSGAKGTLIASLPKRCLSYFPRKRMGDGPLQFNAVRGLFKALGRYLWPDTALSAPINYLTGALGNMANRPWLESLVHGAMAEGMHGRAVDAAGELRLRVVWPTNDTAFRAVHSDDAELATRSLAHNWRYGEDGQVRLTLCIRSHSGNGRPYLVLGHRVIQSTFLHHPTTQDFPYQLLYDAEPKFAVNPAPPSHAVVLYRVAPEDAPLPAGGNGIRGWVLVGSANLAKCAVSQRRAAAAPQACIFESLNRLTFILYTPSN